ncbi:hypothetical protein FSP39_009045, partial [Pinctada imbricata]
FQVLGIGILVPGVLFLLNVTFITDEIKAVADSVSVSGITLSGLLSDLAIVFVCLGTFVTLISILGIIGAACTNKIILIIYVIIVLILALAQLITVILYIILKDEIDNTLKTSLTESLQTNYKYDELGSTDTLSNSFNYLFLTYKCCSFNDISSTTNDFDTTPWCTDASINGRCYRGNGEIPRACCDGVTSDTYTSQSSSCTISLNNYYTQVCIRGYNIIFNDK